jgi:hypothetical protein
MAASLVRCDYGWLQVNTAIPNLITQRSVVQIHPPQPTPLGPAETWVTERT